MHSAKFAQQDNIRHRDTEDIERKHPGLAAFLAGYTDVTALAGARELGGFFETLVYLQLRVACALMSPAKR